MSNYLDEMFIDDVKGCLMSSCSGSSGIEINYQNKTITENGTYTADEGFIGLGEVTVDVVDYQEALDAMLDGTITEVNSFATYVRKNAFRFRESLTTVNFPLATSIGFNAFYYDDALTSVNFPLVTYIGGYAFEKCESLTAADFPLVTDIGSSAFKNCYALATVNFPLATVIKGNAFENCDALTVVNFPLVTSIGNYAFAYCNILATIYIPLITTISTGAFRSCPITTADFPLVTSIDIQSFTDCSSLKALVLRKTGNVCKLGGTNALSSTPIADGTGYIYVPSALIEKYKTATNWSTYAAQFRALEAYTVDGTVTGALDEAKI